MVSKESAKKRAVLYRVSAEGSAREAIKLRRDATILGREKGDVLIDDTECSSSHCQILNISGSYHIFDMNSTNGTFVNNERVIKSKLNAGDIVTIGDTNFRFALEDESKVRHISTIFKKRSTTDLQSTLVDSLIDSELGASQKQPTIELSVTYHDGRSEHFSLPQKVVYIGRASSFGDFDADPEISRKHLMIKLNDANEIFVEDQGSTNGSFLNGEKMKGLHQVSKTDTIKVGLTKIRAWVNAA